jgi:predicted HTH domain antitoxin
MSVTITDDIVRATHLTDAEFVQEIAIYLYEQGRLTLGQASQLAKMPQLRFQHLLASRDIPVHYDEQDFADDLATLRTLHR